MSLKKRSKSIALFLLFLSCAHSAIYPRDSTARGVAQNGESTFYTTNGFGNCSFAPARAPVLVAAMNNVDYDNSKACGMCIKVTGPKGKVVVRVVDRCPGCKRGAVDLSREAFARIAPLSAGRVKTSWQSVPCEVTGNVEYQLKKGSSVHYTAIQVRNHRLPIEKFEIKIGNVWKKVPRRNDNYFVYADGVGNNLPFRVRITSTTGAKLEDTLATANGPNVIQGGGNF